MRRIAFLGLAAVAVVALAMTAASVQSVSVAVDPGSGSGEQTGTPNPSSGCVTNATGDDDEECDRDRGAGGRGVGASAPANENASTDSGAAPPVWQVIVSLGLFVVGGVVVVYGLTRGEDETVTVDESGADGETGTGPVQRPVRLAADVAPSNDVYRAWLALRDDLGAVDERASPADVAEAAVDADYSAEAVGELTRLFCAARYGDAAATSGREREAREAAATLGLVDDWEGDDGG